MQKYTDIRFLESTSNLRALISRNGGRELSLDRATQITACLAQGRLFFESAETAEWQIRPLLVFYGMVGFAKAIYLVRSQQKLENLPQRHGLKDISHGSHIHEMKVKIEATAGTFQGLNDVVADLEALIFHDEKHNKHRIKKTGSSSAALLNQEITLKDILARIPSLGSLFRATFDEEPKFIPCSHFSVADDWDNALTKIELFGDALRCESIDSLKSTAQQLRNRFPFLQDWRVKYATVVGPSVTFVNLRRDSEFDPDVLEDRGECFYFAPTYTSDGNSKPVRSVETAFRRNEISEHCQPVAGSLQGRLGPSVEETYLVESFNGFFLNEVALHYIGMFVLSSLVRYRPHLWVNAIAGRSFPDKAIDDHAVAIIEKFVDGSFEFFTQATIAALTQPLGNELDHPKKSSIR